MAYWPVSISRYVSGGALNSTQPITIVTIIVADKTVIAANTVTLELYLV